MLLPITFSVSFSSSDIELGTQIMVLLPIPKSSRTPDLDDPAPGVLGS